MRAGAAGEGLLPEVLMDFTDRVVARRPAGEPVSAVLDYVGRTRIVAGRGTAHHLATLHQFDCPAVETRFARVPGAVAIQVVPLPAVDFGGERNQMVAEVG